MVFVPRRKSCPTTRLSTYTDGRSRSTRASIDGSSIESTSYRACSREHLPPAPPSSQSSGSTLFYDAATTWEPDTVPFPDFDEEESSRLLEQMREMDAAFAQRTVERLSLWDAIRFKVSRSLGLGSESWFVFCGDCFGRRGGKSDSGKSEAVEMRGGFLALSDVQGGSICGETQSSGKYQQFQTSPVIRRRVKPAISLAREVDRW